MKKMLKVLLVVLCVLVVGRTQINAKSTLQINTVADWNNYHNNSHKYDGWNIVINNDLDFKNVRYNYSRVILLRKGTHINGKNHKFLNMNIDGNKGWVSHNFGTISNVKFENVKVIGGNTSGVIKYNYGSIYSLDFRNGNFYGTTYVAPIVKNYRYVRNIMASNIYVVGNEYVGGVVALNSNFINSGNIRYKKFVNASLSGLTANRITLKSRLAHNKKKYRDNASSVAKKNLPGDYFGGILGKNYNAGFSNSKISNTVIRADDCIGAAVGFNSFMKDTKHNKKAPSAIINNVTSTNFNGIGGNRVAGLVGFSTNNNKLNLKSLATHAKGRKLRARVMNSKVIGTLYVNGGSECGGAIGMSLFAYAHNVTVKVSNNKKPNVIVYYEEAGGFIGDLEFGFISGSRTNASVKTTGKYQAGGFVADSEGTVINSHATGNVYSKRAAGGFVGSNLGYIRNSSFRGNVYAGKGSKKNKAVFVGNFVAYKTGVNKYRGFKLKPRYKKCYGGGKRYVNNKRVKNEFYGRGGQGN